MTEQNCKGIGKGSLTVLSASTFFNRHFFRFDSCMADAFFVLSSSLITIFCRQVQCLSGYPIEQRNSLPQHVSQVAGSTHYSTQVM